MNRAAIFEELKRIAADRQWTLLSPMYVGDATKVHMCCSKGHDWFTRASNIRYRKHGCPDCQYEKSKLTPEQREQKLKQLQEAAKAKRGECTSTEYINAQTKVGMRCEFGHDWQALPSAILNTGTWCRRCSSMSSMNEAVCRLYFKHFFDKEFPSVKPKWLLSQKGYPLELDGYCEELKLAFEYNGKQHYAAIPYFGGEKQFETIQMRDQRKRDICKEKGITLIEIPSSEESHLKEFIIKECDRLSIVVPNRDKEYEAPLEGLYDRMGYLREKSRQYEKTHPHEDWSNLPHRDFLDVLAEKIEMYNNPQKRRSS
jgi:hypothetical protein